MESTRSSNHLNQPAQHTLLCNTVVAPLTTYSALSTVCGPITRMFPRMTDRSHVIGSMAISLPLTFVINSVLERAIHGQSISHPQHTRLSDIVVVPASTYTAFGIAGTALRVFPMSDRRLIIGSMVLSFPLTAPVRGIFENIIDRTSINS